MTRDQKAIADGVRDELLLMFQDANLLVRRAVTLQGICEHYGLPRIDGGVLPKLGPAVLALEAAHAAYEEFSAGLSVQAGDAGAGASAPVPADPLRAAA